MLAVVALYYDWIPFMTVLLVMVLDHGVVGTIAPGLTCNHPSAQHHQWTWAFVHAALMLAESAALLVYWRVNERAQEKTKERESILSQLIDGAPDALIVVDRTGRIVQVNYQTEKLLDIQARNFLVE